MTPDDDPARQRMVRADLLTGAALFALGLAVAYWSWTMPRLEARGIHPLTAPGLVPGILGTVLAGCGAILALRSRRLARDAEGWRSFAAMFTSAEAGRAAAVVALALGYALGLVGLMPFWLATAVFVLAFILLFESILTDAPRPWGRTALFASLQALILGAVVVAVFERGFLVRLP